MDKKKIREILDTFVSSYIPPKISAIFGSWILDKKDSAQKEAALEEMWDEMASRKEYYESGNDLPDASEVLSQALLLENPKGARKQIRRERFVYLSLAASLVAVVVALSLFFATPRTETILMSSSLSKTSFTLPDGSQVCLNRDSRLSYFRDLNGRTRKVRLEGEAFFDVAKDASRPFIVSTPHMDVKVLGTRFTMSSYERGEVSAYLQSGSISVSCDNGVTDILQVGDSFTYNYDKGTVSRNLSKVVNHVSWTGDRMEFANTPLRDILENFEHWYNVTIDGDVDSLDDIRLSLTVRQESLQEILEAISHIAGISYEINGSEVRIARQ